MDNTKSLHYQFPILTEKRHVGLIAAASVAGHFCLYAPVLGYGMVQYDDPLYLLRNPWVKHGLTFAGVKWAFSSVAYFYSPITWLSLMLDQQIYGGSPPGFHLTNVILHAANAVLLLLLCWRLTRRVWMSALVAGLFVLHPLNVEAVAWIAERKGLLGALFCLLCLHAYLSYCDGPRVSRYLLFNVLFVLSLLAKPMALTLPFLLLVLDFVLLKRGALTPDRRGPTDPGQWKRLGALALEKIPMLLAALAMIALTWRAESKVGALEVAPAQSFGYNIGKVIATYWQYLANGFWPVNLSVLYPLPTSFSHWGSICVILLFVLVAALMALKRDRLGMFGLAWFLILLLPVAGVVQLGVQFAPDRYAYLPLVGLFLVLADLMCRSRWRAITGGACIAALGLLAYQSSRQVEEWRDTLTLFDHAAQVTSGNFVAFNNVAWILATDSRYRRVPAERTRALAYAVEACRLTKDNDDRMLETLAVCLGNIGKPARARAALLQAAAVARREGRPKQATLYLKERNQYPEKPGERDWFR